MLKNKWFILLLVILVPIFVFYPHKTITGPAKDIERVLCLSIGSTYDRVQANGVPFVSYETRENDCLRRASEVYYQNIVFNALAAVLVAYILARIAKTIRGKKAPTKRL